LYIYWPLGQSTHSLKAAKRSEAGQAEDAICFLLAGVRSKTTSCTPIVMDDGRMGVVTTYHEAQKGHEYECIVLYVLAYARTHADAHIFMDTNAPLHDQLKVATTLYDCSFA
jgi:hypothetical protein